MRLAIALRRSMTVVQVREKRPVWSAEVLAITTQGVEIQVILEPDQVRPAVHRIDSGAGESPVESVNSAFGQSLRTGNSGWRHHRQSAVGDRLHQRRSERMLVHLQPDVILDRVRQREAGHPDAAVGSRYAAAVGPELVR